MEKLTNQDIRFKLISDGVKNLKEFGYPSVTSENILTDVIYSIFFKNILNDNKGITDQIDKVIDRLIEEIK